jgi:hypothetical protein
MEPTAASATGGDSDPYPVLVVDQEHNQSARPDGSKAPFYQVIKGGGLILDVSHYTIEVPPQYKVNGPNSIHVITKSGKYFCHWTEAVPRRVLDSSTLQPYPTDHSGPFRGFFHSGETVILGIGHSSIENGNLRLMVMWVGGVKIS